MTINDGRFEEDTVDFVLDAMMSDAKDYFGNDLTDSDEAVIRFFYRPIAERLVEAQQDISLVLDSSQIEFASAQALDYLTALIGVNREQASRATGQVTFSRSSPATEDYIIPKGTEAQTESTEPTVYETTESSTIKGPFSVTDSTTYSTSNTSYVTKASMTVDVSFRETVDVSADIRTTNSSYAVDLKVADATNATTIHTGSTTNTSFTTSGPTTYDVSGLDGEITIEYRIKSNDGSTSVELTNSTLDKGGQTGAVSSVQSVNFGADTNTGDNTVTVLPDAPSGVEDVTNKSDISGGRDEEPDDELRERAKEELGKGSRASAPALINAAKKPEDVKSVSIFINDTGTDNTGSGGLPDHSFELVVEGGPDSEIGQAITNTKAAGDTSYGGANGSAVTVTTDLPNGQTHDITFSRPTSIKIYIDIEMDVTDEYAGDDEVRDSIVEYIGGNLSTGGDEAGVLGSGDDVIYGEIEYAIRDVDGVYDITTLEIDTSSSPTGTSNISISDAEVATSDATDSSISVTTTTVNP